MELFSELKLFHHNKISASTDVHCTNVQWNWVFLRLRYAFSELSVYIRKKALLCKIV